MQQKTLPSLNERLKKEEQKSVSGEEEEEEEEELFKPATKASLLLVKANLLKRLQKKTIMTTKNSK